MRSEKNLYTDSTCPKTSAELAIHNKKLQEVKSWLETCFDNFPRVLLLTGPTGSAKSTTVELLCKEQNINLLEFDDECSSGSDYDGIDELIKFLTQSGARLLPGKPKRSIIYVTSLPDAAYNNVPEFRVRLFDAMYDLKLPVLFCLSDVDSSWHLNQNRLFTNSFTQKTDIKRIRFNSVAATKLRKTLKRAANLLHLTTSSTRIESIAEDANGDLRLAINMLQMNSIGRPTTSSCSGKANREETFHMLGRILHAKRSADPIKMTSSQKRKLVKPKEPSDGIRHPLEHDVTQIIQMSSMSGDNILGFLQGNELKFCDNLKNLRKIWNAFSLCDDFSGNWTAKQRFPDEYIAQISARNVMWYNFGCKHAQWISLHGPILSDSTREIWNSETELRRLPMIGDTQYTVLTSPYSTMISGVMDPNQISSYLSRPMNMSWKSGKDSICTQIANFHLTNRPRSEMTEAECFEVATLLITLKSYQLKISLNETSDSEGLSAFIHDISTMNYGPECARKFKEKLRAFLKNGSVEKSETALKNLLRQIEEIFDKNSPKEIAKSVELMFENLLPTMSETQTQSTSNDLSSKIKLADVLREKKNKVTAMITTNMTKMPNVFHLLGREFSTSG